MTKKVILAVGAVVIIAAVYVWFFMWNKPHRNIEKEKSEYVGDAHDFYQRYIGGKEEFEAQYINKAVEITGVVMQLGNKSFTVDPSLICTPDSTVSFSHLQEGDEVTVKGRLVGTEYDDMFDEYILRIDNCVFLQKE